MLRMTVKNMLFKFQRENHDKILFFSHKTNSGKRQARQEELLIVQGPIGMLRTITFYEFYHHKEETTSNMIKQALQMSQRTCGISYALGGVLIASKCHWVRDCHTICPKMHIVSPESLQIATLQ